LSLIVARLCHIAIRIVGDNPIIMALVRNLTARGQERYARLSIDHDGSVCHGDGATPALSGEVIFMPPCIFQ
jgi:hypothetical protein